MTQEQATEIIKGLAVIGQEMAGLRKEFNFFLFGEKGIPVAPEKEAEKLLGSEKGRKVLTNLDKFEEAEATAKLCSGCDPKEWEATKEAIGEATHVAYSTWAELKEDGNINGAPLPKWEALDEKEQYIWRQVVIQAWFYLNDYMNEWADRQAQDQGKIKE